MGLSLAGYDMTTPTEDVSEWIERFIDPLEYPPWNHRAFLGPTLAAGTIPTTYRPPRRVRLGRFLWPATASRWGYGFFLSDGETLENLSDKAYGTSRKKFDKIKLLIDSLPVDHPNYEKIETDVYMLTPLPVSALTGGAKFKEGGTFDVNNCYIVYVVDPRYFWWNISFGSPTLTEGTTTWQDLIDDISTLIGGTVIPSTISSRYLKPNKYFKFDHQVLPPVFDMVAANIGQKVCVKMKDGTVYMQNFTDAFTKRQADDTAHLLSRDPVAGNYRFQVQL